MSVLQPFSTDAEALRFRYVVRDLLRPAGRQCQAVTLDAAPQPPLHRHQPQSKSRRSAASVEGFGCPLSAEEWVIAQRVAGEPMSWEV